MRKHCNIMSSRKYGEHSFQKMVSTQPRTRTQKSVIRALLLTVTKTGFLIYSPGRKIFKSYADKKKWNAAAAQVTR